MKYPLLFLNLKSLFKQAKFYVIFLKLLMILPIVSYGHDILRQKCVDIDASYPELDILINNMWETMEGADGCGLAAPQVNVPVRLFIVDSKDTFDRMDFHERREYFEGDEGIRETFINAKITGRSTNVWTDKEGCLSIPSMSEDVERPWSITIEYSDRKFQVQKRTFKGVTARMIQHEYDHTEGILYLDYLPAFKRTLLLKKKLKNISQGQVKSKYKMKFLQ